MLAGDFVEIGEAALDQRQAFADGFFQERRCRDRRRVLIDGDDRGAGGEDGRGLTAGAEGSIDEDATAMRTGTWRASPPATPPLGVPRPAITPPTS
jgi:hypothetical protein